MAAAPRPPREVVAFTGAVAASRPATLMGRAAGECCWPVGGEGAATLFCCAPARRRRYCPEHQRRAVKAGAPLNIEILVKWIRSIESASASAARTEAAHG
ncbi:hypothetical protein [Brevundimonas sp.]|uniref:hypothetical protein n=1 Tax=Brevundimonas sp. TaxID=1871086 RepID=UPI002D35C576|nr:hypothetical protein [Brevundimonas sp.]HYD26915.1 hypothetical protein [Brevundimonas sp.]